MNAGSEPPKFPPVDCAAPDRLRLAMPDEGAAVFDSWPVCMSRLAAFGPDGNPYAVFGRNNWDDGACLQNIVTPALPCSEFLTITFSFRCANHGDCIGQHV